MREFLGFIKDIFSPSQDTTPIGLSSFKVASKPEIEIPKRTKRGDVKISDLMKRGK